MTIYQFDSYKEFIALRIKSMPRNGRGQYLKMAKHLRVHSTLISQIFKGPKDLTQEQAYDVCEFLGLSKQETQYFILLVLRERAGTKPLKKIFQEQINQCKVELSKIKNHLPPPQELKEEDKAMFYSDYAYVAVRLLTSLQEMDTLDKIAEHLKLPRKRVSEILEFLLKTGLCKLEGHRYTPGVSRTHVDRDSPLVARHHTNWRLRSIEKCQRLDSDELIFTAPLTISHKDLGFVRERLLSLISELGKVVEKSEAEVVACLNIDWFKV